jgi:four helix bundle protein
MSGFRNLKVWQVGKDLAVEIYRITRTGAFRSDFGLRDQIRRSAVSIPSNIAEGNERNSMKDTVRFLFIARGSLAELDTQLEIAYEVGYIEKDCFISIHGKCSLLGTMLNRLIRIRSE